MKCIEDEIPFEIPDKWTWTRLGNIFAHNTGKALNVSDTTGLELTYITTSNLYWDRFELGTLKKMYFTESELEKCTVTNGDLLVCEGGDIGRAAIWTYDENIRIQNHIHRLRAFIPLVNRFYYYVFYLWKLMDKIGGQGIGLQGFSSKALHNIIVPIPPLQEQHNIADKLDVIFAIVNDVEKAKENVKEIIEQVKSRILDLAIRGKLVPQDPNDEPASVLLERIRAEKEELVKQGKIKRDKRESVIFKGEDNSYYLKTENRLESIAEWDFDSLPESWEVCCLGEVCDYGNCVNVETSDIDENAWILDLEDIEKETGKVIQKFTKKQRDSSSTKHRFFAGQVLYSKLRPYLNKVVLADENGYCTSEILPLDFSSLLLPAYARYYLMSPTFLAYANRCSYGVKMPRLSTIDGKKAVVTLPPVAEQQRIVRIIELYFSYLDQIAEALL